MTLRSQIESDVSAVFLNADDFAETATYYPKGSDKRDVVCVIDEDGEGVAAAGGVSDQTVLMVFVSRDPDTGISAPQKGDSIRREDDAQERTFSYDGPDGGPATDADQFAWTLRFVRKLPYAIGGNRRP